MLRKRFSKLIVMSLVLALVGTVTLSGYAQAKEINLSSGKVFYLETVNTLKPEKLSVGDNIDFVAPTDVKVDGEIVIKSGARAIGTVTTAQAKGIFGKPGKLSVKVKSIEGVDGTNIALTGNKRVAGEDKQMMSFGLSFFLCPLFLMMKGGEGVIPAGTQLRVRTTGSYTITVN